MEQSVKGLKFSPRTDKINVTIIVSKKYLSNEPSLSNVHWCSFMPGRFSHSIPDEASKTSIRGKLL